MQFFLPHSVDSYYGHDGMICNRKMAVGGWGAAVGELFPYHSRDFVTELSNSIAANGDDWIVRILLWPRHIVTFT